jgi:hypothetical protein
MDAGLQGDESRAGAERTWRSLGSWAHHPAAVAAASWTANWAALALLGHRYSVRVLYAGWQFLPADPLAADPVGSVWHLHHQPPLWNLLVGAVAAWSPFSLVASHAAISIVTGAVLAAAVADTLRLLGAGVRAATVLAVAATANTQVMQHAFEPRYDLAVAALLTLLVWAVARQAVRARRSLVAIAAIATVLAMTRALYHPVWVAATVGVLAWGWRSHVDRRRTLAALAIPIVAIGGWMAKNQVEFQHATLSSWTGMNLLRSVEPAIDPDRIVALRADGTISGVAAAGHFRFYDDYVGAVPPCRVEPGTDPVLAEPYRSIPPDQRGPLDGATTANFNFECYLAVYDLAGDDARALIRAEPGAWLRARAWSVNNWLAVPSPPPELDDPLWRGEHWLTRIALVAVPHPGLPHGWQGHQPWVSAQPLSLTLLACAAAVGFETLRRRRSVMAVAALALGWTMLGGLVFELGEQARFRSATDPLVLALGVWTIWNALAHRVAVRAARTVSLPGSFRSPFASAARRKFRDR